MEPPSPAIEQCKKPIYKYCIVPECKNTIRTAPDKVFFFVPRGVDTRRKWCKIMKRNMVSPLTPLYCCEDHFDIEEDTDNYMMYKILNLQEKQKTTLRLKKGILPHKYLSQTDTEAQPPPERKGFLKRKHLEIIGSALSATPAKQSVSVSDSSTEHYLEAATSSFASHGYIEDTENKNACEVGTRSSSVSLQTPGTVKVKSLPVLHDAEKRAPRTGRPRPVEPPRQFSPIAGASLLRSPVRPRGSALPCEPIKVTSGPSVLQKCQGIKTLDPDFNPVITEIKSEAVPIKQEEDPQSDDTLSIAEDTDQLSDADQPSEDLIPLSNAQAPLSNAPDPLSDVKVEELEVGVDEVEVTGPEEVNRPVEVTRPVELTRVEEVSTVPLPQNLRQELFRAGNDCYNLIRIQANQINKLNIRCEKHRQKLNNYVQVVRRRNKKISDLQRKVEALRNFIGEHGWDASSIGGGNQHAPRIQIQSSNTAVVQKKPNRQLLIVKRDNNRPKPLVSAQPTSEILQKPVGVKPTSDILQKPDGVKPTSDILQKPVGVKPTSDILQKPDGVKPTSDTLQKPVGVKPSPDILQKPVGVKPTSDILQTSVGVKPTSDILQTSVGVKPTSDVLQKSVGVKPTSVILQKPLLDALNTSDNKQESSVGVKCTLNILEKSSVGTSDTSDVLQKSSVAGQDTLSIPKTSLVPLQRTSNIILKKSSSGIPDTSKLLRKSSDCVKRISDILNNPSVTVQPASDIPQTSSVGFQRRSDIPQNALVIQIDGMHNNVLKPKLVRLDDNSMETG